MAIIGIDLGTTYSAAARCVDGRPEIIFLEGDATLPSVVGLQANGKIAVGKTAKRNQAKFPLHTIIEVKRKMGKNEKVKLGDKEFTPQEISAFILRRIKELAEAELGEPVTGAVITCPAYFMEPQRKATEEAGELAGLKVLHVLNEPTAAAYAYGVRQGNDDSEKLFVVYDLGGGTFDVTIIKMMAGSLEVIGTGGDPELGGGNFDDCIVEWMLGHLRKTVPGYQATLTPDKEAALKMRLKSYAEDGKKKLCDTGAPYTFQISQVDIYQSKPVPFTETLTMEKFDELILDLVKERSLKWVEEALKVPKSEKHNYTEENLTAILLVGGSTRVPLVRRILQERFPTTEIRGQETGINPDEIVALGASILAADKDPESDRVAETSMVDVTGHTLNVAVFDTSLNREILHPIIPKETSTPCAGAHEFASLGRGQPSCQVKVYQGEGREIDPQKVTLIGEFVIRIAPIMESTPLEIGLALDDKGILTAHATDRTSGQRVDCQLKYEGSARMSPGDVAKKKAEMDRTLNAVHGQPTNPLDAQPAGAPANTWKPPTQAAPPPPAAPPGDITAAMNPILRNLYNKAINSFDRVPAERQDLVMQLVSDIEMAAQANDQGKLREFSPKLAQALQGVS